jgi:hypothetical protein
LAKPDMARTVINGRLVDLCGECTVTIRRGAERAHALRAALSDLAHQWTGNDEDNAAAARLLRGTGLPLNVRWALFKALRSAARNGDAERAAALLDRLIRLGVVCDGHPIRVPYY